MHLPSSIGKNPEYCPCSRLTMNFRHATPWHMQPLGTGMQLISTGIHLLDTWTYLQLNVLPRRFENMPLSCNKCSKYVCMQSSSKCSEVTTFTWKSTGRKKKVFCSMETSMIKVECEKMLEQISRLKIGEFSNKYGLVLHQWWSSHQNGRPSWR